MESHERSMPASASSPGPAMGTRASDAPWNGAAFTAVITAAFVAASVAVMGHSLVDHVHGASSLGLYASSVALAWIGAAFLQSRLGRDDGAGVETGGLDIYSVAYLAGGARNAVAAAFTKLHKLGALADPQVPIEGPRLLHDVAQEARAVGSLDHALFNRCVTMSSLLDIRDDLERRGLLRDERESAELRRWPRWVALTGVALALPKIAIGAADGRPVTFLVMAMALAFGLVLLWSRKRELERTHAGDVALRLFGRDAERDGRGDDGMVESVAFGGSAFAPTALASLFIIPMASSSGGSSCGGGSSCSSGSSCGSSCGGGGCGGGGCGG